MSHGDTQFKLQYNTDHTIIFRKPRKKIFQKINQKFSYVNEVNDNAKRLLDDYNLFHPCAGIDSKMLYKRNPTK